MKKRPKSALLPRLRVIAGETIALGPGKVDLLERVATTGSIRQAAEQMGMSYMRAWKLIKTMNSCFKEPVVDAARGGPAYGGAQLTATGHMALKLYRQMEKDSVQAATANWKKLSALLCE